MHDAVAHEAQEVLKQSDSSLFHDYLSEIYAPSSLQDFLAHAARHGLGYLTDAAVLDTWNVRLAPETIAEVDRIAAGDRVLREQYFDLLRMRAFRQTLLCRNNIAVDAQWKPERAVGLYVSTRSEHTGPMQFTAPGGVTMSTTNAAVAEYLRTLVQEWPKRRLIGPADAPLALELFRSGIVDLHTVPGAATSAGDRPIASPLARYEAARGLPLIGTLDHRALSNDDPSAREFLLLLDGTRDHAALAAASGLDSQQVEARLDRMARLALLMENPRTHR